MQRTGRRHQPDSGGTGELQADPTRRFPGIRNAIEPGVVVGGGGGGGGGFWARSRTSEPGGGGASPAGSAPLRCSRTLGNATHSSAARPILLGWKGKVDQLFGVCGRRTFQTGAAGRARRSPRSRRGHPAGAQNFTVEFENWKGKNPLRHPVLRHPSAGSPGHRLCSANSDVDAHLAVPAPPRTLSPQFSSSPHLLFASPHPPKKLRLIVILDPRIAEQQQSRLDKKKKKKKKKQ